MKKEKAQTRKTLKNNITVFGNLRVMVCAALFVALSIIFGKFLQIPNPFQNVIRISFENTPLIMSGILFGPAVGAITGLVADIVGCVMYGYAINPIVTIGATLVGFIPGVVSHYIFRKNIWLKSAFSVLFSHLIGSVAVKSVGLAAWYLAQYNMGLAELMLWRLLTYLMIGAAEFAIICALLRNRSFSAMLARTVKPRK